jgi:hypothetical protein
VKKGSAKVANSRMEMSLRKSLFSAEQRGFGNVRRSARIPSGTTQKFAWANVQDADIASRVSGNNEGAVTHLQQ